MKQCRLYKSRLWSTKRPEARNTGEPLLRSTEHTHTHNYETTFRSPLPYCSCSEESETTNALLNRVSFRMYDNLHLNHKEYINNIKNI